MLNLRDCGLGRKEIFKQEIAEFRCSVIERSAKLSSPGLLKIDGKKSRVG